MDLKTNKSPISQNCIIPLDPPITLNYTSTVIIKKLLEPLEPDFFIFRQLPIIIKCNKYITQTYYKAKTYIWYISIMNTTWTVLNLNLTF